MNTAQTEYIVNTDLLRLVVKKRSDALMDYFLPGFFLTGLVLATFYQTWFVAVTIGTLCLVSYYSCKLLLPESNFYQYVLGAVLGVFMAQFIFQMHGMFEMHFFAFIGSAILITYQNWRLQIPLMLVVFIHHAVFSFLQNNGIDYIYFTQLDVFTVQTFVIHVLLASLIFFICGLWAYQLKTYSEKFIHQSLEMSFLRKEADMLLERKQNEEALLKAYTKAEEALAAAEKSNNKAAKTNVLLTEKNKELEQFVYIASHDLQEPLRTIAGFVDLLQRQYNSQLDENAEKYFNYISSASARMRVLIQDLLVYSRIGVKKEFVTIDCNVLLGEVLADLGSAIEKSGAVINAGQMPVIKGYPTEMKQLFQNLLINAIKFRKPGVIPEINVLVKDENDHFQFSISDNGIGIEEQHKEKVFLIFQRLHTNKTYEGSGIGLAHTKKIVELHGGKIWIESEIGKGTTFHFTLLKNIESGR